MPHIRRRTIVLGTIGLIGSASEALARSGVIAGVIQESGASPTSLQPGTDIDVGQTISTAPGETVALLFVDGTSLILGQRSVLRIEAFEEASSKGKLVLTLASGTCRLICGAIGESGKVTLQTPAGTIDAQDAIATFSVTPHITVSAVIKGLVRMTTPFFSPPADLRAVFNAQMASAYAEAGERRHSDFNFQPVQTAVNVDIAVNSLDPSFVSAEMSENAINFRHSMALQGSAFGQAFSPTTIRATGSATTSAKQAQQQPITQKISAAISSRPYQATLPPKQ